MQLYSRPIHDRDYSGGFGFIHAIPFKPMETYDIENENQAQHTSDDSEWEIGLTKNTIT